MLAPMQDTDKREDPVVLGWRERVSFPEWRVGALLAKVDTGARTSSIDVVGIEVHGSEHVRFEVVVDDERGVTSHQILAELVRRANVKPSTGQLQRRCVVRTTIRLGSIDREIELNLNRRRGMICRMLLGRTALEGCVVDPNRAFLVSQAAHDKDVRLAR